MSRPDTIEHSQIRADDQVRVESGRRDADGHVPALEQQPHPPSAWAGEVAVDDGPRLGQQLTINPLMDFPYPQPAFEILRPRVAERPAECLDDRREVSSPPSKD
jgi:hypothetical protein